MATATAFARPMLGRASLILYIALALLAVGFLFVSDSGYALTVSSRTMGYDPLFYLKRHGLYALGGLGCLWLGVRVGYRRMRAFAPLILLGVCVMLCLVWVPGVGIKDNGSNRWLGSGAFRFQPSEFAKLAVILFLAAVCSRRGYPIRDLRKGLAPPLVALLFVTLLIEREPDLGTAVVVLLTGAGVLYLAGARLRHLTATLAVMAVVGTGVIALHGYRGGRFTSWLDPYGTRRGLGYQVFQSLMGVIPSGLLGVGIGEGSQKYYLPAANSDYIMATVFEETGLLGASVVIGAFAALVALSFAVARRAADRFGMLVASGIGLALGLQAALNLAVVTNTIPSTGVPLPLVSYGGSSLLVTMFGIGLLLSVAQGGHGLARYEAPDRG